MHSQTDYGDSRFIRQRDPSVYGTAEAGPGRFIRSKDLEDYGIGDERFIRHRDPSAYGIAEAGPERFQRGGRFVRSKDPEAYGTADTGPERFVRLRDPSAYVTTETGPERFVRHRDPETYGRSDIGSGRFQRGGRFVRSKDPEAYGTADTGPERFVKSKDPSAYGITEAGPERFQRGGRDDNKIKIPEEVADAARMGLLLIENGFEGGTPTGWNRAMQLAESEYIDLASLADMRTWFARHGPDASNRGTSYPGYLQWLEMGAPTHPTADYGSNDARGAVSWLLWGGDPAYLWLKTERIRNLLKKYFPHRKQASPESNLEN